MFLPPLGGGIFSSTKCLLYPFPVSRPITWRYYLREVRPTMSLYTGHIKSKTKNRNVIWLYVTMSNQIYAWTFRKYAPMGCQKAWKEDQRGPRCTQRGPQRASMTRDAPSEAQKRSPGGGPRPQRRSRSSTKPESLKNQWVFNVFHWKYAKSIVFPMQNCSWGS